MNRKNFFKQLFGIAAVAVVAPSVLAEKEDGYTIKRTLYPAGIKDPTEQGGLVAGYDMVPKDGKIPETVCSELNPIERSVIQQQWLDKREWDSHYNYMDQRKIALKRMMEYYKDVSFTEFLSIF